MNSYVVTGSASGIGRAIAMRLIGDGHRVIGWDRTVEQADGIEAVVVDLTSPDSIERAAARLPEELAGLINAAGVPGTADPGTVLAVNLWGTMQVTLRVLPGIRRGGAVVSLASIAALRSQLTDNEVRRLLSAETPAAAVELFDLDGSSSYDASKKALLAWSQSQVAAVLRQGVRMCTVSPGPTQTPILEDFRSSMGDSVQRAEQALARNATADEVAAAATFLVSDAASWINGIDLRVDGGLVALASARPTAVNA